MDVLSEVRQRYFCPQVMTAGTQLLPQLCYLSSVLPAVFHTSGLTLRSVRLSRFTPERTQFSQIPPPELNSAHQYFKMAVWDCGLIRSMHSAGKTRV
jgi:hypothetical protein